MFGCASTKSQFLILFIDAHLISFYSDIIINTVKTVCLSAQLLSMDSSIFPIIFIIVLRAGPPGHSAWKGAAATSSATLAQKVLHQGI